MHARETGAAGDRPINGHPGVRRALGDWAVTFESATNPQERANREEQSPSAFCENRFTANQRRGVSVRLRAARASFGNALEYAHARFALAARVPKARRRGDSRTRDTTRRFPFFLVFCTYTFPVYRHPFVSTRIDARARIYILYK